MTSITNAGGRDWTVFQACVGRRTSRGVICRFLLYHQTLICTPPRTDTCHHSKMTEKLRLCSIGFPATGRAPAGS